MPHAVAAVDAESPSTQRLEDRYGTGRRRRLDRRFAWIVAIALLLAGLLFLLFSGWQNGSQVEVQDIGHTKQSERVPLM